jgi:hypothetical protein
MNDRTLDLTGDKIGVARADDGANIVIFIPGRFVLTIDEATAAELGKAIYAKATRMPADEVETFFGRFDAPPTH